MIEVACGCGWVVRASDLDVLREITQAHDATCSEVFEPDRVLPDEVPEQVPSFGRSNPEPGGT